MKKQILEIFKIIMIFFFGKFKKITLRFKKSKSMKDIMMVYYSEAKSARLTGKKVAWITSGALWNRSSRWMLFPSIRKIMGR